jgi:hypothetical protein
VTAPYRPDNPFAPRYRPDNPFALPDFSDVASGAASTAHVTDPRLAQAIFGTGDLLASSAAAGVPVATSATPPLDTADARRLRVALGAEQPRLSERIAPTSPGIAGTLGDMAEDVENVVRGLPSGAIQGLVGGGADALTAAMEYGSLPAAAETLARKLSGQPVPAEQARALVRERVETPAVEAARRTFQPEGVAGRVGEQVGNLGAQAGALKLAALAGEANAARVAQRLAMREAASDALTAETMERIGQSLPDGMRAPIVTPAPAERKLLTAGTREPTPAAPVAPPERAGAPAPAPPPRPTINPDQGRLSNLRRILGNESGQASFSAAAHLGGAATGAAAGYITGDDQGRVGRTITGAIAGGIAGSMLAKAAVTRGVFNRAQLAMQDADVAAVLHEGGPRAPLTTQARGVTGRLTAAVRSGWQKLVDDVYAAREFGRRVGKTEAVSEEASRAKGWRGFGNALVGTRPTEAVLPHPTLRAAVEAAKGREADVTALLRAERAIELDDAGKGWYLTADRATTEAAIQKLTADPQVRDAADKLRAFYDHLLELRYQSGLLSTEEYQAIRQAHQRYVPFVPATEAETLRGGSAGGRLFNRSKGVRRLTEGAGGYAKVDPFQQAVDDAYRTARDVSRQRAMQAVSEVVTANPDAAAPYLRAVSGDALTAARRRGEGRIIDAIVGGKRQSYEVVDPDLADALGNLGPAGRSVWVSILSGPARLLKAGVTSIPSFVAANASRDAFFTAANFPLPLKTAAGGAATGAALGALMDPDDRTRGALIGAGFGASAGVMAPHALRIGAGIGEVLGNTGLYQEWLREGGAGTGFYVGSQRDAARLVQQLKGTGGLRDLVSPRSWWDAFQFLNEAVEQAPRVAKYAAERAAGTAPRPAAVASREVSVDFARGGSQTKTLRATSAFWNPNLQGKVRLLAAFKSPKAWATGVAAMTAPTVALWAINKDDPEYWKRPLWERNTFWLIPAGHEDDGRTRFLKLPKPFEVGFVFGSIPERMLDLAYQHDPERTTAAMRDMLGQVGQGAIPIPTAAMPVGEVLIGARGYDTFRNRDIVTSDVANLPSREQYNLDTSGPAIGAARAIEYATGGLLTPSPQKVEHVIRGYTGTLGSRALAAGDRLGKRVGLDDRAASARTEPSQFDRFVTRPNDFGTDDVRAMFRRFDQGEQHYRKVQDLVEQGRAEAARAYAQQHRDALADYATLKPVMAEFRTITQARRTIEQSTQLTAQQKQQAIAKLGTLASALAARGTASRAPTGLPASTVQAAR